MEPFEDVYGILRLVATQEEDFKESDEEENFIDKDDFLGELEVVLQSINNKGGFDSNKANSF